MTSKTIVFFGNERLATGVSTEAPTLKKLIDAGYTVAAVVSNYEQGTSRNARKLEIQEVAELHGIPVLLPSKPSDIIEELQSYGASVGVLVAYGKIVSESIINIFPKGIVNLHPSLLPLHRGPTPIESVILDGSLKTGVSIMSLVKAMDAGPVYAQREVQLSGTETKQELVDSLLRLGGDMLIDVLPGVMSGTAVAESQNNSGATYDNLIEKHSGVIDWNKPAVQLEREIRAYAGWPKSRTTIADKDVIITKASFNTSSDEPGAISIVDSDLIVACGQNSLKLESVQPAGKKEMTAESFLAGHKHLL